MAKNTLKVLGASNLSNSERAVLDYYGTDEKTIKALLDAEKFDKDIWEPASGHGNILKVLKEYGYNVFSSDINNYGHQDMILDFLDFHDGWHGDIITNPPYCLAGEFVSQALKQIDTGKKVAMLLRIQFLEGQKRYDTIFKNNPPARVYVFTNRQVCSKVDDFSVGSAIAYIWGIWEKGYTGDPIIKWLKTK